MSVLLTELWLPAPLDEVFAFFASARNLEAITPPWLSFRVETPEPIEMHRGTRIDYQLRLHGFPLRWQSEISAWEPPYHFVDEQRVGPYRRWRHQHDFVEFAGGTFVQDHVEYRAPGGPIIDALFVRRDLERIFAYRAPQLRERFGARG